MTRPIDSDHNAFESIELILRDPQQIRRMDDEYIQSTVELCLSAMRRLRMGGRSSGLTGLSLILWTAHERDLEIDPVECLALAFRIAADPSYARPEWGLVLAGVLIARYLDRLPTGIRDETGRQCRLLLRHMEACESLTPAVQRAASALLTSWDAAFPEGLMPVLRASLDAWPETSAVATMGEDELRHLMGEIEHALPASMSERERALYRLSLDRQGKWQVLEGILLT